MLRLPEHLPVRHALIMVLISAACTLASWQCVQWSRREERALAAARATSSREFERARAADAMAPARNARRARYDEWRRHGIVGPARRIDWVEAVRGAGRATKVPLVEYELGPAQRLSATDPPQRLSATDPAQAAVFLSSMKLRLGLRHEEQLLDFLAALEARQGVIFRFDGCEMKRLAPPAQTPLEAQCTVGWINIHAPGEASK